MSDELRIELQQNNPLHGLKIEDMIQQLVDHYGWEILDAAMRMNCFNTKPTVASSVKYLKKTEWARERVENFYLYRFKRMPKASDYEYNLPPRARTFPHGLKPREPMELTVESILLSQAKAASAHKERSSKGRYNRR
ncbi:VF530 family DNA-binding protein [Vibrio sp. 404]|uniref:VF530 family DNA-binding protein n=1 Tax=Vibrio marinisediminis TaxID=2758441 RepID=A0A7W2IS89_9VIBR|nr:VF530 family DNA-binding protein [Vibrio marinisediminis]MBA5761079.1 VF530 family DNA-binding protein [Vibrio marinisediminis]